LFEIQVRYNTVLYLKLRKHKKKNQNQNNKIIHKYNQLKKKICKIELYCRIRRSNNIVCRNAGECDLFLLVKYYLYVLQSHEVLQKLQYFNNILVGDPVNNFFSVLKLLKYIYLKLK